MEWKDVIRTIPDDVIVNEFEADKLFDFLSENKLPHDVGTGDMRSIYETVLAVMKFKGAQAGAYFEELVRLAPGTTAPESDGGEGRHVAQLERELREKDDVIRDLRAASSGHTMSEVRELRAENSDLRRDIDRMKRQSEGARDEIQSLNDDLQRMRNNIRELERERDNLLQDVGDYKKQIQWQSQNTLSSAQDGGAGYYRDLLRKKDHKLDETLDEVERLATANASMEGELGSLTAKLDEVDKARLELVGQMTALRTALKESDMKCQDYKTTTDVMKEQITELTVNLKSARGKDRDVSSSKSRVPSSEWSEVIAAKDQELLQMKKKLSRMENQLRSVGVEKDKKTVSKLTKILEEREQELKVLREELADAAGHIEDLMEEVELCRDTNNLSNTRSKDSDGTRQLVVKVAQLEEMLKHEREQRIQVESEKANADEEILHMSKRVRDYETGDYGLSEAVDEIKRRKGEIALRDEQIRKLTEEVNRLNSDVDTACEENEVLRERLGLSSQDEVDVGNIRHRKSVEIEKLKAVNRELEKQVDRLEEDRVDLRQQLLLEARKRAERNVELGLTTDSLISVEEYAEKLRASTRQMSPHHRNSQVSSTAHTPPKEDDVKRELESVRKALEKYKKEYKSLRTELKTCRDLSEERLNVIHKLTSEVTALRNSNEELKKRIEDNRKKQQRTGTATTTSTSSGANMQEKSVEKWKLEWNQELELVLTYLKSGIVEPSLAVRHLSEKALSEVRETAERFKNDREQQKRRIEVLQNEVEGYEKRMTSLTDDLMGGEKVNAEKITQLEQDKMAAQSKLTELEQELVGKVSKSEMESLEEQHSELAAKLRETLSKQQMLLERLNSLETALHGPNVSDATTQLVMRNKMLEEKCQELTRNVLQVQNNENLLRQKLADGSTAGSKELLEKKLRHTESSKEELARQLAKVTEMEEVAQQQCLALATITQSQQQEVAILKKQLEDLQTQSDEKVIIANLNQKLIALQTSEAAALQKAESHRLRVSSLQAVLWKTERKLEEKKEEVFGVRRDLNGKVEQLQATLRSLQRKYASSVPLAEHQRVVSMAAAVKTGRTFTSEPVGNGNRQSGIETAPLGKLPVLRTREQVGSVDEMQRTLAKLSEAEARNSEQQRLISKLQLDLELAQKRQLSPLPSSTLGSSRVTEGELAQLRTDLTLSRKDADHLEKALHDTKTLLIRRETEMAEMRIQLGQNQSHPPRHHAPSLRDHEQDHTHLSVAQQTIEDMKSIISQKESMVDKYQNLLQEARRDAQVMTEEHNKEMMELTRKLHKEKDEAFKRFKQASLDALHNLPTEVPQDQLLSEIQELKETMLLKDQQHSDLSAKLKAVREDHNVTCQQYQEHIKRLKEEIRLLESEQEFRSQQFEKVIKDKSKKISDLEMEVDVLDGEVRAAREASRKSPARTTRDLVEKLKADLVSKDRQYKALSEALVEVRAELIEVSQKTVDQRTRSRVGREELEDAVHQKTAQLQAQVERFKSQLSSLEEETREARTTREKNMVLIEELQEKLLQRDSLVSRLESEISSRQKVIDQVKAREKKANEEIEALQHKLEANQEAESLQKRVKILHGRLEKERQKVSDLESSLKQAREAASHSHVPKPEQSTVNNKHSAEEVIRWEEGKKWQKRVESLKNKLMEKSREVEDQVRQMKSLKDTLDRTERDRGLLQSKLRSAQKAQSTASHAAPRTGYIAHGQLPPQGGMVESVVPGQSFPQGGAVRSTPTVSQSHSEEVHQFKKRIFELENELTPLRSKLSAIEEGTNEAEKKVLGELQSSVEVLRRQCVDQDVGLLAARVEGLQSELLACQKCNLQLKFEHEQVTVNLPRLKARIADLEDYNEVLKKSLAETEKKLANSKSDWGGKDSTPKSTLELERVITAMKKVIEKLRQENEDLKRRSVKTGKKVERTSSEKMSAMEEQVMRASSDNEALMKALKQEKERVCQLQSKVSRLESLLKRHREQEEKKDQDVQNCQERIESLQTELDKKSDTLKEVKHHLQVAAKREEELAQLQGGQEQIQHLLAEREHLRMENRKLQEELRGFDQSFFDEIEEIKFNYHESLNKIKRYQEQLNNLSTQYNITIPDL